ncbi:MAG: endopeptidase La [Thioalkalivibrionaceae bacterium]
MMSKPVSQESVETTVQEMPALPLRDVVVYPHMVIPLFVGRERSIKALEAAMAASKQVFLVAQKSAETDEPEPKDLYTTGAIGNILQMLRLPDGTIKVLVEGVERAECLDLSPSGDFFVARVRKLEEQGGEGDREVEVLGRSVLGLFEHYIKLNKKVPPEILTSLSGIDDVARLVDTIAAHMSLKLEEKQKILEITEVKARLEHLIALIEGEMDVLQIEKKIRGRVKQQMEKSQREYYLNEQMKAIQKELGDLEDVPNELEELEQRIEKAGLPKAAKKKVTHELNKLKMMSPMSAEATVVRSYIDWAVSVPWNKRSRTRSDLSFAKETLDRDHHGLEEVKDRILEYLAVQARVKKLKGPILCLVGPPGVGKTSLGQSIAKATGRKFTRMALGGVRDEAEIRGHRRTYIGSLPGKIVQNLSKAGARNPLFLLDEIDKMAMDFRGDPSSALLEVLDPEQNHTFNDHYLELDLDLSEVMFVATANSMNIPGPLLDRMEVIRLSGYTEDEKVQIAVEHLVPKQIAANGLKDDELRFTPEALRDIVRYYSREAGVRSLEREIAKICRKVVKELLLKSSAEKEQGQADAKAGSDAAKPSSSQRRSRRKTLQITPKLLEKYLGVRRYRFGLAESEDRVGQVTGLAWTEVGGELLTIETAVVPGKGKTQQTGKLGDVMQESIHAALTVVRARAEALGIPKDFHEKNDLHIHVPEGATPKDGPSAGVGMCTAIVSALTGIPVRADVAMTGEITLRGQVLPIGGLKEKLLAAHRGGIRTVLIPEDNRKDLVEIPKNVVESLEIRPVSWIDEVLEVALVRSPSVVLGEDEPAERAAETAIKEESKRRRDPTKRVRHH